VFEAVARAIRAGLVAACHDCADGGVAVAVAEMAIGGGLGAEIDLAAVHWSGAANHGRALDLAVAFAESPGRFVVAVPASAAEAFAAALGAVGMAWIGAVTAAAEVTFRSRTGAAAVTIPLDQLDRAWRTRSE
jgi:phosphoribosylformylglycinamidine synthase